jgi:hypothetical protein
MPEVFCFGADFKEIQKNFENKNQPGQQDPEPLYNLWLQLALGPFITIAHVQGKTNAGGVGFVAACDVVLCDEKAVFSLSELLFGLMPACVLQLYDFDDATNISKTSAGMGIGRCMRREERQFAEKIFIASKTAFQVRGFGLQAICEYFGRHPGEMQTPRSQG